MIDSRDRLFDSTCVAVDGPAFYQSAVQFEKELRQHHNQIDEPAVVDDPLPNKKIKFKKNNKDMQIHSSMDIDKKAITYK